MASPRSRAARKAGLPPGSLVYTGEAPAEPVRISVIDYDANRLEEKELGSIEEAFHYRDEKSVTWINIDGLHQVDILEKIGNHYGIHPLVLEDILNTAQRPKFDEQETYLFTTAKMMRYDDAAARIVTEQISFVVGPHYLISFQETRGDVFDSVRERLRTGRARIRKAGTDYLLYALLDAIVDHYFLILEKLGDRVEEVQEELLENPTPKSLSKVNHLKRELATLRRSIWPLREVTTGLERSESRLIKRETRPFLRDIYDHTIQVMETIESFREQVGGMLDVYLSSISNRTNDVMKVLTMIATIFIPLSFLAGLYGMNFDTAASHWNMPELHTKYGYPVVVFVMLTVAGVMLAYFKRKKWL